MKKNKKIAIGVAILLFVVVVIYFSREDIIISGSIVGDNGNVLNYKLVKCNGLCKLFDSLFVIAFPSDIEPNTQVEYEWGWFQIDANPDGMFPNPDVITATISAPNQPLYDQWNIWFDYNDLCNIPCSFSGSLQYDFYSPSTPNTYTLNLVMKNSMSPFVFAQESEQFDVESPDTTTTTKKTTTTQHSTTTTKVTTTTTLYSTTTTQCTTSTTRPRPCTNDDDCDFGYKCTVYGCDLNMNYIYIAIGLTIVMVGLIVWYRRK